MARMACACVPLFPLAARLRAEPELRSEAVAIVEGNGPTARLLTLSRVARRYGLRPGMTLAQARSILSGLIARPRDAACERSALEALAEAAERLSPRFELDPRGLAYLDLEGCLERFAQHDRPEQELALVLEREIDRAGLPARVGIASSRLAARLAAQGARSGSPQIVPCGQEGTFLAPLSLARLDPTFDIAQTLHAWGVRTLGDLARLPVEEVTARLGEEGRKLAWLARGRDPSPLVPSEPPRLPSEGMSLEWPLASLEPFLFLARAALDRLIGRLEAEALGCVRLELELELEPAGRDRRTLDLPAPMRDRKTLLELVRWNLEARPPGAPVSGFTFFAHPDRPRAAQLGLFAPPELSPDRLATTLARLFALLGPDRVGSPRPTGAHRPGAFELLPFAPPPVQGSPEEGSLPPRRAGLLAVRCLRPPVPIEVHLDPRGRPARLEATSTPTAEPSARSSSRGRISPPPSHPPLEGRVRVASGPWWLEELWWHETPMAREYWDIELDSGLIARTYREHKNGLWFADGLYD